MKLHQIIETLTREPLLITPSSHASLMTLFEQHHAAVNSEAFQAAREGTDICGEAVSVEQAEIIEGIMYIPVGGPIGVGLSKFEKGAGCVDCADICDELDNFQSDPNCRAAIMNFDSPGGMVKGIAGVTEKILACDKPIYAFTAGQMCSAAYWLGSACDSVFATTDADVGSIGCYCYLLDQSKRYEAAGVKPVLVTSGKYKGMGAPGVSFTKAQLDFLQERIDDIAAGFYAHVDAMRQGAVSRQDMQGQVYPGAKALSRGLVDGLVRSIDDVAALLS